MKKGQLEIQFKLIVPVPIGLPKIKINRDVALFIKYARRGRPTSPSS